MSEKWLAKIKGIKKPIPFSMKDYLIEWVPVFPFLGHINSVTALLTEPNIPEANTGDIYFAKFGGEFALLQYTGEGFSELNKTSDINFGWRWAKNIRTIIEAKNELAKSFLPKNQKLNPSLIVFVKKDKANKMATKDIAAKYGVSPRTIQRALANEKRILNQSV